MLGPRGGLSAEPSAHRAKPAVPKRRLPPAVAVAALLVLGLALLYPNLLLRGEVFQSPDARNADAFRLVGDRALAGGHYPLWNPYLFAGMPTFGSLAYTRFVYPPSLIFDFLQETLGFPPTTWLLAHLLFGGLGMAYLLSRWRLPLPALVLGALAWILLPKVTAWAVHGHGSKLAAAMYLPWIVAGAWNILAGRGPKAVALTALLLGLQFLRGHLQITYYTLLVVGWLALCGGLLPWLAVDPRASMTVRWRRVGALAAAVGVAFLVGAVLLVPLYDYAGMSVRGQAESGGGADYAYATDWSLPPSELPTFVFPAAAGFGRGTYLGQMPFTDYPNYWGWLLLFLAIGSWWSGRRGLVLTLGVLSGLGLLVAMGRDSPFLFDLLYGHLPFFNKFRVPSMILIVPSFALAVLSAHGAAALGQSEACGRRWRRLLTIFVAGLGIALLLLGGTGLGESSYLRQLQEMARAAQKAPTPAVLAAAWGLQRADLLRIGLILMAAGAALFASARRQGWRGPVLLWTLAFLVAFDLMMVDTRITHPENSLKEVVRDQNGHLRLVAAARLSRPYVPSRTELGQGPSYETLARRLGHERVLPLGHLDSDNGFMVAGVRSLGGYYAAKLADYEEIRSRLYRKGAFRLASWLAAKVVAVPGELPPEDLDTLKRLGIELSAEPFYRGKMALYENLSALPRARWARRCEPAAAAPGGGLLGPFLDAVQSGSVAPNDPVFLDPAPSPLPDPVTVPLPEPEYVRDGLDEVVLRTAAPVAAVLVLADMAVPGWRVTVDGQAALLLRADLVLRAVALPAGQHEVRFTYRDPAVSRGLMLSLLGLTCVMILGGAGFVISRRHRRGAAPPVAAAAQTKGAKSDV